MCTSALACLFLHSSLPSLSAVLMQFVMRMKRVLFKILRRSKVFASVLLCDHVTDLFCERRAQVIISINTKTDIRINK